VTQGGLCLWVSQPGREEAGSSLITLGVLAELPTNSLWLREGNVPTYLTKTSHFSLNGARSF
jgi:hypothetical protein